MGACHPHAMQRWANTDKVRFPRERLHVGSNRSSISAQSHELSQYRAFAALLYHCEAATGTGHIATIHASCTQVSC